jgi:hypothetical protein
MKIPIDSGAAGSGATVALLNGGADFVLLDLWKLTLNGGAVIRWHGGPMNTAISFAAATGQSTAANGTYIAGPVIDRGKINTKLGLEVATVDLKIAAASADLVNGAPLIPFAQGRGFDGASVVLYRAFLPNWGAPNVSPAITGVVIAFSGRVTQLKEVSRAGFTMTVSAWTVLLNVNMGPDVFQAGCLNTHYDANCGLAIINSGGLGASPPQNQWTGTVGSSPAPTGAAFHLAGAAAAMADHYFDKGTLLFTSGVNSGLQRAVQTLASGLVSFAFAFPAAPAPGDAFTATRGCLLTLADCKSQRTTLDAERHFRGQPFTPPAITGAGL